MPPNLVKERYENVTTMIRYHNDKMIEAFVRFTRFSVGIIAGSIGFISLNDVGREFKNFILYVAPVILWFIGISSIAIIWSNWKSWLGFRKAESEILNIPSLVPHLPKSIAEQLIMVIIVILACVCVTYVYYCILPDFLN